MKKFLKIRKKGEELMNILRWRRKSKKKIRLKTLILVIFSLIMTTFAWFAYSKVLDTTLNLHVASWDMKYSIGGTSVENPIGIDISTLYPTMEEQSVKQKASRPFQTEGQTSSEYSPYFLSPQLRSAPLRITDHQS